MSDNEPLYGLVSALQLEYLYTPQRIDQFYYALEWRIRVLLRRV